MLIPLALGAFLVLLLVCGLAAVRRFQGSGDAFRCRLRVGGYPSVIWPARGRHWLRPMWPVWDQDVLVVRSLARALPPRVLEPVGGVCG